MQKTILITGATDGLGLATAESLVSQGHHVLIHGRNEEKLANTEHKLGALGTSDQIKSYRADLSNLSDVVKFAQNVVNDHKSIDVLINNAGIFKTPHTRTTDNLDVRFAVNTFAPYIITKILLPVLGEQGRVINLSSAAQAPVSIDALSGKEPLADMDAYAQSKLAITQWSKSLSDELSGRDPMVVAVNPGSLLASKMVKEGFGVSGNDLSIGVDILCRAALSDEFRNASGKYFDNDAGKFDLPHPDGVNPMKIKEVMKTIHLVTSPFEQT